MYINHLCCVFTLTVGEEINISKRLGLNLKTSIYFRIYSPVNRLFD